MRALLAVGIASFGPFACAPPSPRPATDVVAGRARVVDGDTLEIAGRRLRLVGIDAPELRQTCAREGRTWRCGRAAAHGLARKVKDRDVTCALHETDRWDRPLALCTAGGTDLSAWLAEQGWALAFRRYGTAYLAEEDRARAARQGMWSGSFTEPGAYRAQPGSQPSSRT